MMTVKEVSLPENMPSSSAAAAAAAAAAAVEHQKAKAARRRRLEMKKLAAICKDSPPGAAVRRHHGPPSPAVHGAVSVMGRRREMEDSVAVELGAVEVDSRRYDFFGVFDGHGGSHVAEACRDRMHSILREELRDGDTWRTTRGDDGDDDSNGGRPIDWEGVMVKCFERMDREVAGGGGSGGGKEEVEEMTVGSTAVTAVVGENEVVVANCGDSRAVICRNGVAIPLSIDHKPDRPDELARIEAAGGRVINWNGYRVLGVLATSRSIGDHYLKPYVSSTPEVTISKRTEDDEFLILASDGLWDVISNEVACQIVKRCLTGKILRKLPDGATPNGISAMGSNRAGVAAALLVELAMAKGSKDNISVIVVELRKKIGRFVCS